jgi:aspartyl-tRNA(Asn)/glutamyl-tRNA(Gln) amidotransferase subunit A
VSALREGELETALEIRAALDAREVRAADLVERSLERAEAWQPFINAFSQLWPEEAMEAARLFDASVRPELRIAGELPLASVTLAVKDLFDVSGRPTTGCCAAYRDNVVAADAEVVVRMRRAKVIVIGKTNQHELAAGGTNTVSACGRTGNPWKPQSMTGGSSGGSAAAVAAGIVPLALGSDTGGSIRIPSSMCGTFGLKPTTGRIPTTGMMPLAPSMDCPGPMAATLADLHLLYGAMIENPPAAGDQDPARRFRVAIPNGFFAERIHPEVLRAVSAAGLALESAAVAVEAVDGHGIEDARRVWMRVCTPEFVAAHPLLKDPGRRALVHPSVVEWLEEGERLTAEERQHAAVRRKEVARWFGRLLERFDALLVPTTPYPAPKANQEVVDLGPAGEVSVERVGPGWLTCSVNLAGLPALNLPTGRSSDGLPIGVSLVGKADDEQSLFRLAALWEESSGYRRVQPQPPAV